MSTPTTTAAAVIIARINAHLALRGLSATGLARAMGRSHTWLLRKLDPEQPEARPIMLEDLDRIAFHLGITGAEILAPCLTLEEVRLLTRIRAEQAGNSADYQAEHLRHLVEQGLITVGPDGDLFLTPLAA